ncbi:MAG: 16S rRNA (adenine(1518)-N(6)/adenine(1519)-N(6))-dimethyltransferase RsmA [Oscillospiraceae bacterium]|jgi:16S rRNA (adenine1518-N6/adenine1519-N6)-dimethyltransferase|nr:16S rRNA (adenine(1518)-N(6)/adenine(1519)-N(6))-dimethyltransferase RsmA [Oscillospiraceae bacterium]
MSDNIYSARAIRDAADKCGLRFSKLMGQNFLINRGICSKMIDCSQINDQTEVIEIGPGMGALTLELAKTAKKVVAIELDKRLASLLKNAFSDYKNVKIICGDALKIDIKRVIREEFSGANIVLFGNLPYCITTPIITDFLEKKLPIKFATLMIQKEAASRICAQPGTRQCGAISFAVRYFSEPRILFNVKRGSFFPVPNIDSSVIELKIREISPVKIQNEKLFFKIIKTAFLERRKAIKNPLSTRGDFSKEQVLEILKRAKISPLARAEQLCMKQFANLSNAAFEEINRAQNEKI